MSTEIKEIKVPDIGGAHDVLVIDVPVKVGDQLAADATIITLESDKASMDIPVPFAGVVKAIHLKVGDKVSEGSGVLSLEVQAVAETAEKTEKTEKAEETTQVPSETSQPAIQEVRVPDIGTDQAVKIIDLGVKVGDEVKLDQALITLESDKASMDVPAPFAGKITELKVKVGDSIQEGDLILLMETKAQAAVVSTQSEKVSSVEKAVAAPVAKSTVTAEVVRVSNEAHAGPAVRRLAHQLGVDLNKVTGTGRKGRILPEDIHAFVKRIMQGGAQAGSGFMVAPMPSVDFAKFGEVTVEPLSRIKKLSGANLHRNWVMIPHVTQFEEADITELEVFRQANKADAEKLGVKLTPLVFIMKAVVATLQQFPQFNASLNSAGDELILKKYFHIGVAVDTPNGLVVPVIRDVDKKNVMELAQELAQVSQKAREGKLTAAQMQGGCFSISSLGGIGGTAFTPIINAPEVAILGVSRSEIKPKWKNEKFEPRLMLPLSLSYDHRVIDGAQAARFTTHLSTELTDMHFLLTQ